jgi:hypothetical protein
MIWIAVWVYLIIGELTVLWVLGGPKKSAQFYWLAEEKWWVPYLSAIGITVSWPAVVGLLVLVPVR